MKTHLSPAARLICRAFAAGVALVAALVLTLPCHAAPGVFMKLDGVDEWSELTGASSELKVPAVAGAPTTPGVRISKRSDLTSPLLLQSCGDGTAINRVTLAWRDAAGVVFRITLGKAVVRSFRTSVEPRTPADVMEECAFTFDTVEWSWFGHDGADVLVGGRGVDYDVPAQQATERVYRPFRASLGRVAGRPLLNLTCVVERGRSYRISASTSLNGEWVKLEDFTATEDGQVERQLTDSAGRLFLRVEALD